MRAVVTDLRPQRNDRRVFEQEELIGNVARLPRGHQVLLESKAVGVRNDAETADFEGDSHLFHCRRAVRSTARGRGPRAWQGRPRRDLHVEAARTRFYNPAMSLSRRDLLAAVPAMIAATAAPAWPESYQTGPVGRCGAAEAAEAALARAKLLGASYADIRINRYRRESIATRERQVQNVSRSTSYGLGLRVLVERRLGLCRDQPRRARCGARRRGAGRRDRPRQRGARLAQGGPAPTPTRSVTTWTSAFKRDPFEVPLDTKIAFLMKLNETALAVPGVTFVSSQMLFVDEQKFFASSEGSRITQRLVRTYPQFSTTAADRASGDFQTRAVVDRAQLVGYEYVEDYPVAARTPRRPATKWSRS